MNNAMLIGWTRDEWRIVAAYHLKREGTLPSPDDLDVVFDKFIDAWYADGGSASPTNPKIPPIDWSYSTTCVYAPPLPPVEITPEIKGWVGQVWVNAWRHIK